MSILQKRNTPAQVFEPPVNINRANGEFNSSENVKIISACQSTLAAFASPCR
jgi:hypothetical protein